MARIQDETLDTRTGSVRSGMEDLQPRAQVEGTLTGEVGLRCQLTHRPQREGLVVGIGAAGEQPAALRFTCALRTRNDRVTRTGDSQSMRRLALVLSALSLACAGTAVAAGAGKVPPIPRVPGQWSHVEINLKIRHVPHTLILDRGRIVQASATSITVRELGSSVVIPLNAQTLVVIDGLAAAPTDLRRRMSVVTMRIDGGAAVRVRASSF